MALEHYNPVRLSENSVIRPFKCSDEDLNGFLFDDAKNYLQKLLAVTYTIEDETNNHTIAYFSLLTDKISFNQDSKSAWNKINREIPNSKRRKSYPALKIGRLAVHEDYSGQGIGKDIINYIMYTTTFQNPYGCRFLTVDALLSAIPFYQKCGFRFFSELDATDDTRLMFYDLMSNV